MDLSKISFTADEVAAIASFNQDNMPEGVRAKLDDLNRITAVLVEAKNVAGNAATEKGNAWHALRDVAFAIIDATPKAGRVRELAFNSVLTEYVNADKESAKASLKAYVSTARNMMLKLHDVKERAELEQASYKQIREWLSPKDNATASAIIDELRSNLAYVGKHAFKGKSEEEKAAQLLALNLIEEAASLIKGVRDSLKSEKDSNTSAANIARELQDMKPKAPTAPTSVESKAA